MNSLQEALTDEYGGIDLNLFNAVMVVHQFYK
jgi:hypothetical protein